MPRTFRPRPQASSLTQHTGRAFIPPARSSRAARVIEMFGLNTRRPRDSEASAPKAPEDGLSASVCHPGTITLITGPSGAGKSSLLRSLHAQHAAVALDVAAIDLPEKPIVDCFDLLSLQETLLLLSRVGLGEAWSYIRTPAELSDGQRWRLRLALAVHACRHSGPQRKAVLIADEFAALLDRVTARVVSRAFRRMIDAHIAPALSAIVATSHDDLIEALMPDLVVRCDFGRVEIQSSESSMPLQGR